MDAIRLIKKQRILGIVSGVAVIICAGIVLIRFVQLKNFSYTINEVAERESLPLVLETKGNSLSFTTTFIAGGSRCQKAKLVKNDKIYQVIFYNTNSKYLLMNISCELSGKIYNIPSGRYQLQIVNGNKDDQNNPDIVDNKEFQI